MAIRFRNLVKDLELDGKSIMDAGCGMGDLLPYIYAKTDDFNYLGIDKSRDFIDIATKRYEGHKFQIGDPFNGQVGKFDVILSSGVMNGNVEDWLKKRKKMIANLFNQTKGTLAFNMAGSLKPIPSDSLISYADAQEIADYCKTLAKKVILRTDYLDNDFTIVMHKQ